MAEFKLGRIRFVWKGAWSATTTYYVDDVIKYGGQTYICVSGHTSSSNFYTDSARWNLFTGGQNWLGDWNTSTAYNVNDIVKYGGSTYVCNTGHTSAATAALGLEADQSKWDTFAEGFNWLGDWATSTRYKINDLIKYGGITYVCNTGHTSAATAALGLEADQSKWDSFNEGLKYLTNWSGSSVKYKVNDIVKYGGGLWICTANHVSSASFDTGSFAQLVEGFEYEDTWGSGTTYQPGDVVSYGGNQYVAKSVNSGATPSTSTANWDLFSEGFSFQSDWVDSSSYKIGEVVKYGGDTYIATADVPRYTTSVTASNTGTTLFTCTSTTGWVAGMAVKFTGSTFGNVFTGGTYYIKTVASGNTFTISTTPGGTTFTPSTASGTMTATVLPLPVNTSYFTRLNSGIRWVGQWTDDTEYLVGDAVRHNSNTYICILGHRSDADDGSTVGSQGGGATNSRPDQDTSGTYWNVLTIGSETSTLTTKGDLVYYGGAGPTRLPIGTEGQILRVGENDTPEWAYLWASDHVYYVAPHGTDAPYPEYGSTLQSPWASIRYACEQVDKGPRNKNAQRLLELNRIFIQREVTSWIDYQINYFTNTVPTPASIWYNFDYDEHKCERDTGLVIDAVIHDIGHGGNVKSRGAALAYVGALEDSPGTYARLSLEKEQDVAAFNYMLEVVESVLENQAPAVAYQTIALDSTAIASQYIDTSITAEAGVMSQITELVTIINDAITAGNANNIPARYAPNNLIQVKTGRYREVLPIIVPAETCILGDEVRSTNAGPAGSLVNVADTKYSIGALGRLEAIIGDIVQGNNVVETSGNTAVQSRDWPFATTNEDTIVEQLARVIQHKIDFNLGTLIKSVITDPTGYNSSFLSGYGDARTLLNENKKFLQDEIIAFIAVNYPSVKYSKTACRRDVGYIVDAMIYDLTYSGSTQSLAAGLAYFDGVGSTLMIDSTELTATIASYNRLKTVMQQVVANTTVTKSTGNTATQWTDSGRSSGSSASSFIGANIDIITAILTGGSTTFRPNVTVTTITGTDTVTTSGSHGLAAGDLVIPRTTANGLTANTRYYVLSSGLTSTQFKVSTSYAGSAATLTNGTGLSIVLDTEDRPTVTNGVTTTTALITAYTTLSAAVNTIVSNMTSFISANYPSLTYDSAKCQRDARIILDAVGYDFMFNSNFQSLKAAYAYLRSSASDVFTLNQKAATRAAFTYVKTQAKSNVGGDATAQARIETLMTLIDDIIYGATNEGSPCASETRTIDWAVLQIEKNRSYIVSEINAWIANTYKDTATATTAATSTITIADTSWLQRNAAIRFTGTTIGGLSTGVTYYVQNVVSSTTFKVATTRDSNSALAVSNGSGSMGVVLHYDAAACERDVQTYIDAIKYDLKYPGNYKSLLAARYYSNAVKGSLEEDMYYLRNGTGIRNQTLEGLTGDLLAPNAYGTSRVSAGAYCSLDPGWGPNDFRTWIITRSPYVQNVTTFGYAAVGQKIDGALHAGGNDSIVSNDFTQVISDGIGAWVTNNGRAELVSVFSYYAHIGYLAENGGRIRGTNGNNSYGDFGSVAEGVDASETPNTAVVDNRQFKAIVGSVLTDQSDDIFQVEFDNAGSEYTEATWNFTGAGLGVVSEADEFRDDAVFQVRLLDNVDDSSEAPEADGNFGGFGYVSNANTAQSGTSTSITLAATDGEISSAYVGMKIYLTGGVGVGQFGIISTYNAGTKQAVVVKESDGTPGWDHIVPGTTIQNPDASTTYVVEPRITFSAPAFNASAATLPTSGTWSAVNYGDTTTVATGVSGTYSGTGASGATWNVYRNGSKYVVTQGLAGTGYTRLQTITIAGTSLGGLSPTNDLVITITAVNSTNGAIQAFDYAGYGLGGRFVAVRSGSQTGATSEDGVTWTTRATLMPSSANWSAIAHGMINDGSSNERVSRFVAVAGGSANTSGAYSADGITWTASSMVTSATWVDVTFGEGKFVAISSDSTTVRISLDGEVWDQTGTLTTTGFTSITYGMGLFVAVRSGSTTANYSTDGVSWTAATLPASSNWNSVTWGNGRFVAIATNSNSGAYSLDGVTWTAMTVGSADGSTVGGFQKVAYGQGLFMATTYQSGSQDYSFVATSENGVQWTVRGVPGTDNSISGWNAVAFGNPQRVGRWVVLQQDSGTQAVSIRTGARARGRAFVSQEKIFAVRIHEPGSGYDAVPTMTITDPNNIYEAPFTVRIGKGALANPSFKNRGTGMSSANAEIDTGNGYADFFQDGQFIAVRRLTDQPVAGSNVVFGHLPNETFKLVNVFSFLGSFDGSYSAIFQISPPMKQISAPDHLTSLSTRIRYSQVRLTGHDFLDIGTGNFDETNYPGIPDNEPVPANETVENNGGRVFYTSTDQDGNFRVGGLFNVEQSTGVATLNADAFNIAGLQELTLGEVTLGGSSASITEFSTDPFFTANSDNIIPTQRAIKAYISSQIGGGGASLNVNSVTAGSIFIATNTITTTTGNYINFNAKVNFTGGISGIPLAFNYFIL